MKTLLALCAVIGTLAGIYVYKLEHKHVDPGSHYVVVSDVELAAWNAANGPEHATFYQIQMDYCENFGGASIHVTESCWWVRQPPTSSNFQTPDIEGGLYFINANADRRMGQCKIVMDPAQGETTEILLDRARGRQLIRRIIAGDVDFKFAKELFEIGATAYSNSPK